MTEKTKTINLTILTIDCIDYQEQVEKAKTDFPGCEITKGITVIPVAGNQQGAVMPVYTALVEYKATEEEYRSWKFRLSVQKT